MTKFRLHLNQDVAAGLLFIAFGAAGLWFGQDLALGRAARMGPGYVPWALSWALVGIGGIVAIKGAAIDGDKLTRWSLRPLVLVPAAVAAFALLLEPAGLPIAGLAIVVVGALGGPQFRLIEVLILALGLVVVSVALFIYGLRLPMAIWPT
jgi:hypothetical protein